MDYNGLQVEIEKAVKQLHKRQDDQRAKFAEYCTIDDIDHYYHTLKEISERLSIFEPAHKTLTDHASDKSFAIHQCFALCAQQFTDTRPNKYRTDARMRLNHALVSFVADHLMK